MKKRKEPQKYVITVYHLTINNLKILSPVVLLLHHSIQPILYHCFLSIPPENIRKPEVFRCFQGVQKENCGLKWVKTKKIAMYENLTFDINKYIFFSCKS